jgi:hypothetical protein
MADLLAFLRSTRRSRNERNSRQCATSVQPNPDGSVAPAISCEIYGTSLVFESKYNNLGFWGNETTTPFDDQHPETRQVRRPSTTPATKATPVTLVIV